MWHSSFMCAQLSSNLSLDGIREFYDYRATTEAGNKKLIDAQEVTDTDGLVCSTSQV